jgi:hypothetical protein
VVDLLGDLDGDGGAASMGEQFDDGLFVQPGERHLVDRLQAAQRPAGGDHADGCVLDTMGEERQDLGGGGVQPLPVVHDHQQWCRLFDQQVAHGCADGQRLRRDRGGPQGQGGLERGDLGDREPADLVGQGGQQVEQPGEGDRGLAFVPDGGQGGDVVREVIEQVRAQLRLSRACLAHEADGHPGARPRCINRAAQASALLLIPDCVPTHARCHLPTTARH